MSSSVIALFCHALLPEEHPHAVPMVTSVKTPAEEGSDMLSLGALIRHRRETSVSKE